PNFFKSSVFFSNSSFKFLNSSLFFVKHSLIRLSRETTSNSPLFLLTFIPQLSLLPWYSPLLSFSLNTELITAKNSSLENSEVSLTFSLPLISTSFNFSPSCGLATIFSSTNFPFSTSISLVSLSFSLSLSLSLSLFASSSTFHSWNSCFSLFKSISPFSIFSFTHFGSAKFSRSLLFSFTIQKRKCTISSLFLFKLLGENSSHLLSSSTFSSNLLSVCVSVACNLAISVSNQRIFSSNS